MSSHVFTTLEKLLAYQLEDLTPETNSNYNERVRFWTKAWKSMLKSMLKSMETFLTLYKETRPMLRMTRKFPGGSHESN